MKESEKLKLLAGLPFKLNNIDLCPLSLRRIADIGYEQYNLFLMNLVADPKDFQINKNIDISTLETWDIIVSNMIYGSDDTKAFFINALELFFHSRVRFFLCKGFLIGDLKDKKIVCKENYEELKRILKIQNCLDKKKEEEQFANDKAREIYLKIMKGKQSIGESEPQINFEDLVSVLAANGNGLNILNIWDLTLAQFNNQFARMQMIEKYDIDIRQLLAGAKPEDIKLKHYIRPIENN
jgi:hypothetical protein